MSACLDCGGTECICTLNRQLKETQEQLAAAKAVMASWVQTGIDNVRAELIAQQQRRIETMGAILKAEYQEATRGGVPYNEWLTKRHRWALAYLGNPR